MRSLRLACGAVCLLVSWAAVQAADYPLTLSAAAQVTKGTTTVTSTLTIRLDRIMNETFRTRVTDALRHGGYPNFLPALRSLPVIGTIETDGAKVEVRYAREERLEKGSRLVLVADRPLFFLGDSSKARAGYELTLVDLTLDAQGTGTGTISGAACVKPTADGSIVVDDFAVAPVKLSIRTLPQK